MDDGGWDAWIFVRHNPGMGKPDRWSYYLPTSPPLRDGGLAGLGAGERRGAWPTMRPRRLSSNALVFVTSGSGTYAGAGHGEDIPVRAPCVVWLFPGVEHAYGPGPEGWHEHWVLFEGAATRAYEGLGVWRRSAPVVAADPALASDLGRPFAQLREGLGVPGRRAQVLAATLTHGLIGIADRRSVRPATSDRVGRRESAAERVVASAFVPATVEERARSMGTSPDRLRREIREQTGLTVHELVIQTRLARAQSMLATTRIGVAAIARQVGYDDPAYFSRVFSARVGMPPVVFRSREPVD